MGSRKRQLHVVLVAFVGLLVLFVGWQPQPAACMMVGMLALSLRA